MKRYHELPVSELWLVDVEEGRRSSILSSAVPADGGKSRRADESHIKRWIAAQRCRAQISSPPSCAWAS
ncbi:hypothetical protein ACHWUR_22810 [Klebsiella pneumoniae]